MSKIRRINQASESSLPNEGLFSLSEYWAGFIESDLGKIYQAIPWEDLVKSFKLEEKPLGRKSFFSPSGKLGLMILKNYSACSDDLLLKQLNGNIYYQLFCGVLIDPSAGLKHRQLVSSIRGELALNLSIEKSQLKLAQYWKAYLPEKENMLADATCYESEVRYPTDVKLLWESVSWLYERVKKGFKELGLGMPRTKYRKWYALYQIYRRKRKPRVKQRKRIKGGLLRMLKKLLDIVDLAQGESLTLLELKDLARFDLLKTAYKQQNQLFLTGEKPKGRIVSLAKPYLRPIVRGKENKPVEFGAKVNKIQLSGINFIEHLNFEAFHEGNRLKRCVSAARKLVGKIKRVAADQIYAPNKNRRYCTENKLFTDFKPKGRKSKLEDQRKILRQALTKERVSRLEGSFGNEKNYYHLRKVKARTKENEILWIFFGIHTPNALEIGRRMQLQNKAQAA